MPMEEETVVNVINKAELIATCIKLHKKGYKWASGHSLDMDMYTPPIALYINEKTKKVMQGSIIKAPYDLNKLITQLSTNMPNEKTPTADQIKLGAAFINQYGHQVTIVKIFKDKDGTVNGFKFNDGEAASPSWTFSHMKFVKQPGKPVKAPKANFLLKYDLDEDPIEEYETMKQVDDRIKYLVENVRELKKESIIIYEIKKKHRVTISTRITKRNA